MAHQTEIMINGVTTEVTEFDHTAQEIDDGIDNLHTLTGGATTPQGALANLGAGVRPNLLINPFFEVNQRGQSTYNSGGYCLDCWKIVYISTGNYGVTAHDDYIEISAGSDRETRVDQFLENPNAVFDKTVTGTVLLEDGSLRTGTAEFSKSDGSSYATETLYSDADFELLIQCSPSQTAILRLVAKQNKTVGIKAVKLEFGSEQTLAYQAEDGAWQLLPQPESDYATQLAKCQRYLWTSNPDGRQYSCVGVGVAYSASAIYLPVNLPVTMRGGGVPTVSMHDFSHITLRTGGSIISTGVTGITTDGTNGSIVAIVLAGQFSQGDTYVVYTNNNDALLLSREL